ncbi:MAG TPA: hypothetical protein VKL99_09865 [Candidatus Angelobacter sp.]|nr:hypothetical protein [Candidatus Angelobacter sp.]
MSLRKVYGGTPVGNESRCATCVNARIIVGYAESERLIFCDAMYPPTRVPFNVRQCSMYEDRRLPDFDEMKEFAWEIRSKSAGARAGFAPASEPAKSNPGEKKLEEKPEELPAARKE